MKSCPTCNRTFEDTFTFCLADGALLSAPFDPKATLRFTVPQSSEPPPTAFTTPKTSPVQEHVKLTVRFSGKWMLIDSEIEVMLDEQSMGLGSLKNGIDITTYTTIGKHSLELKFKSGKKKTYQIELPSSGQYEAALNWDDWRGGISNNIDIRNERA